MRLQFSDTWESPTRLRTAYMTASNMGRAVSSPVDYRKEHEEIAQKLFSGDLPKTSSPVAHGKEYEEIAQKLFSAPRVG